MNYEQIFDAAIERLHSEGRYRVFIDIHVGFEPDRRIGDVDQDIAAIRAGVMRHFKNACVTVVLGPEDKNRSDAAPTIAA